MNPWDLSVSDLLIWGIVLHLIADWPLQNDWMANGKAMPWTWSAKGLAPAFAHGLIHTVAAMLVFGFWPGYMIGVIHIGIDTRIPVAWWSRLIRQTQPRGDAFISADAVDPNAPYSMDFDSVAYNVRHNPTDPGLPTIDAVKQLDADRQGLEKRLLHAARPAYDIGTEVRFWTDQVFHIAVLAIAALIVGSA